jgi:hypothetical protein
MHKSYDNWDNVTAEINDANVFNKDEHRILWPLRWTLALIMAFYLSALYFRKGCDTFWGYILQYLQS